MTLLLVEDEERIIAFLTIGLEAHGYTVEHATGAEALERLAWRTPDLILLDLAGPRATAAPSPSRHANSLSPRRSSAMPTRCSRASSCSSKRGEPARSRRAMSSTLRSKLGHDRIETIRGVGYRLHPV